MIDPALAVTFLKKYWKEAAIGVVIASLSGYVYILRIQKDNITLSFENYKLAAQEAIKDKERENDIKRIQSDNRKASNDQAYAKQIEAMQSEIKRLAGSNAGLVSINAGLLDAANSSRRALSALLISSRASADTERDCHERLADANRYIAVLTPACKQTDTDYKALRQAWDDDCEIKGCE